ncbi:unnamed protein product, partial [Musa textilis]
MDNRSLINQWLPPVVFRGRSLYLSCPRLEHSIGNSNIILLICHSVAIQVTMRESDCNEILNREEHNVGRAHVEDGDFNGDHVAGLVGRPGVVLLTEGHDVDALGTQGGPHRRRGRRLARLQRELHDAHHCKKAETKVNSTNIYLANEVSSPEATRTLLGFPRRLGGRHGPHGRERTPGAEGRAGRVGGRREAREERGAQATRGTGRRRRSERSEGERGRRHG